MDSSICISSLMRKIFKTLFLTMLFCGLFGWPTSPTHARSVSIPSVNIQVQILPDGIVLVEETRTIQFKGSFTEGFYTLPVNTLGKINNFTISDEDGSYEFDPTFSKRKGTFTLHEDNDQYTFEYYFQANNTTKTFTYTYMIGDAIALYEDQGEFYWQLQGDGWDDEIGRFEAHINWENPVPMEEYYLWAYGPLWGEVKKVDEQSAYLLVESLPGNTFVEIKLLLPPTYFTFPTTHTGLLLEKTLKEEQIKADQANAERARAKRRASLGHIMRMISYILAIGLTLYYFYLYLKHGKEHQTKRDYIYYREPPDKLKPAIVGKLYNMNSWNDHYLQATLLDLIHRKHIAYEKIGDTIFTIDKRLTLLKNKEDSLAPYEEILLNKIFFGEGDVVELKELRKRMEKSRFEYKKHFEAFKKSLDEETKKHKFFDETSIKKSEFALVVGSLLALFIPLGIFFLLSLPLGSFLIFVPVGILYIAGSKAIRRRTPQGAEEFHKWKAFRDFIKDFSNLKEYCPNSLIIWEKYLIFATTFGIASVVLKALEVSIPSISDQRQGTFLGPALFASGMTPGFNDLKNTVNEITSISSSLYRTATTSSGSGGGGGFSSGGGGGGGGSGGGFR